MRQRLFIFFVCISIVCSGCAMQMEMTSPLTVSTPAATAGESAKLPVSHGPFDRNHRIMQEVGDVFQRVAELREADRFSASELQAITRASRFSPVTISGCDLEVLKIFVASNWVPVVVITSPVGPKHVRAVTGYDDSTGKLNLVDPVNYAKATYEYSEFSRQWDDPQKTCLLIFSERVGEDRIKFTLKKYLPEEKVNSLQIGTSKKGGA